jgi:signal transduction histidine kinase
MEVVEGGAGLTSIRDRVGSVGGEVEMRSSGGGTVVRFEVPAADSGDELPPDGEALSPGQDRPVEVAG